MKLYVKYIVNKRCKDAVKNELRKLGFHFIFVDLSTVEVMEDITDEQFEQVRAELLKSDMELIERDKAALIEKVGNLICEKVRFMDESSDTDFPDQLNKKLNKDYAYLSGLFSEGRGTTIENFIASQKLERVKELIIYDDLNFENIARKMHYRSVANLSGRFKESTGLTLAHFRKLNRERQFLTEEVRDY